MSVRFTIGDTRPDLDFEVYRDNAPIPVVDVASIAFKLLKPSGATVTRELTLVDAATARYQGNFLAGDLDEGGDQEGELIVTWDDDRIEHGRETIPVYVRREGEVSSA